MKISVSLEKLKRGLLVLDKIVASKSTLPILNNVLIKVDENQVVLSATDLEMGISYYLGGKIDQPGSITVPGRVLSSFVGSLVEDKIELEGREGILYAKTDKSEANLNGMPADEFPSIPEVKGKEVLEIDGSLLKLAINQVGFAASFDESRPIFTGVYFEVGNNTLKLAATDSYRLAEKVIAIPTKEEAKFIVPIKTIQEIHRVINGGEKIKVTVSDNQIMFSFPDMDLVSRVIEGEYPDYTQVIPKVFKTKAIVSAHDLLGVVKTASFFARESANNVRLTFGKGGINIEASSSQLGNFKSSVTAEVTGEDNDIGFNARYVLDALNGIGGESVAVEMVGKLNPGLIRPADEKSGLTYIIMPLRS